MKAAASAAETAVYAAAVALMGDFTHFTWWALALYTAFLAASSAQLVGLASGVTPYIWVTCLVVQAMVISGVVAMSATRCDTLVDAAADNGPWVYTAGNFALHYWPTVGIVARAPRRPVNHTNQAWVATLAFLVYATVKRPNSVYGCPVPYNVVVVAGFAAGALFAATISSHVYVVRHW